MGTTEKKKTVATSTVKKAAKKKKLYHLKDFYGCLKGKIVCDDAIFNLGVKS
jgi:hypothetical protein